MAGCQVWATSIDWIGIKFDAAEPVYLLTGLFGSSAALNNSGYVDNLKNSLGLYSKVLDHGAASIGICNPNQLSAINANADAFIEKIKDDGELVGASEIHMIGHSMGGWMVV